MSFEIGPQPPIRPATAPRRAHLSLPAEPPVEVRDAVGAAAARAAELRAANRELHFQKDERSGHVVVQVRDLAGNVIRTIPPSAALDVMSGAPV
jgi:hypothetical protein